MARVKPEGPGQGKGGGRPRRQDAVEEVRLRLTPRAAEQLRAAGEAQGSPAGQVVERLLTEERPTWHEAIPPAAVLIPAGQDLPPEALAVAQECADFLNAHQDRPAALHALRRAWKQALALTSLELRADP